MPRNRTKHVKQARGSGRKRSGGPTTDKLYKMQMKDASSGEQRVFNRTVSCD